MAGAFAFAVRFCICTDRPPQLVSPDGTNNYTYDDINQLTAATLTGESYSWDSTGNRTNTGYSTGTNNRLLSDGTYTYEYDAEGNRTKRTDIATGDTTEYTWDHHNRLTGVSFRTSGGTLTKQVQYTYDVFDRLIGRQVDNDGDGVFDSTERFVYDGDDVVLSFDGAGSLTHRYLHGDAVDQVFASEDALGEVLWALTDDQGTVRDIADYDIPTDTLTFVNQRTFDSFGNITSESNPSVEFRYYYTGRFFDADSGLQYNRRRWYEPTVGRWISEDPIGFRGRDANLSRYVGNSPANFVDPDGLKAETELRWHHLLPQKHRNKFARNRINIDQPRLGWIMSHDDHVAIHRGWNAEWDEFFRDNPNANKKLIGKKLGEMMSDKRFKRYLDRGVRAEHSHGQWNRLKPALKAKKFAKLRKAGRLLGRVGAVCGAAGLAYGAFSPIMALGDDAALNDYENAMRALQQGRLDLAEKALFGEYLQQGAGVLLDSKPKGLIPKMLAGFVRDGTLARNSAIAALKKAHDKFNDIRCGGDGGRKKPSLWQRFIRSLGGGPYPKHLHGGLTKYDIMPRGGY